VGQCRASIAIEKGERKHVKKVWIHKIRVDRPVTLTVAQQVVVPGKHPGVPFHLGKICMEPFGDREDRSRCKRILVITFLQPIEPVALLMETIECDQLAYQQQHGDNAGEAKRERKDIDGREQLVLPQRPEYDVKFGHLILVFKPVALRSSFVETYDAKTRLNPL